MTVDTSTCSPALIPPPPNPRQLLADAGLLAKKSFGQHFLLDQSVLAHMAELADAKPGCTIVELGAGLGALTHHLLARGAKVVAIERDRDLVPLLRQCVAWAGPRLVVVEADAAKVDYAALAQEHGTLCVAGNLPYQIGSRILVSVADASAHVAKAVFLVQREVAERVVAAAGSSVYGLLSVLVQRRCHVEIKRMVSRHVFLPPPKVQSAVLELTVVAPTPEPSLDRALVKTARAAFQSRRKMLRSGLASALHVSAAVLQPVFAQTAIDPTARAETLEVADLARLGACLLRHGLLE